MKDYMKVWEKLGLADTLKEASEVAKTFTPLEAIELYHLGTHISQVMYLIGKGKVENVRRFLLCTLELWAKYVENWDDVEVQKTMHSLLPEALRNFYGV